MSDNVVLDGRPYGDVAILWHNRLDRLVTPYKHFSTRCCAVKVHDFGYFYMCVDLSLLSYRQFFKLCH